MRGIPRIVLLAVVAALAAACGGEAVGRICDLGVEAPGNNQAVVASPSLDCTTRTCLKFPKEVTTLPEGSRYPEGNKGLCTAECESEGDCERVTESPCVTGFTCGIAVTVGPFCCKNFCICKDYIILPPEGERPVPPACDADDPAVCNGDRTDCTCDNLCQDGECAT